MDQGKSKLRDKNPREKASIFSIITFFYTYPLFKKGHRQKLEDTDIYEIVPWLSSKKLGNNIEDEWCSQVKNNKKKKPSVLRVLLICFWKKYLLYGFLQLSIRTLLLFLIPDALGKFVAYFEPGQTKISRMDLYKYASLVVGLNVFSTFYNHNYQMLVVTHGLRVRSALAGLIFRKSLKLGPMAFSSITMGKIVTFITKDVFAFESMLVFLNDIFVGFVQVAAMGCIIYMRIGVSVFIGLGFMLLLIPIQIYLGRLSAYFRVISSKKSDERLQLTTEVLSSIKIVKMFTWENFFESKINNLRRKEVDKLAHVFYLKCVILIIGSITSNLAFFFLILSYVWLGNYINAELVYYIQSCFTNIKSFISVSIPYGITQLGEVYASLKRLQEFMDMEELVEMHPPTMDKPKPKVSLKQISSSINDTEVLRDVSMYFEKGLHLISGNVGQGKSSILKVILGEYPVTSGERIVIGTISYASQDPWLFPSSIRQNILFGQAYDEKRYNDVLRVCALKYDLGNFEHGDQTIVGDRGLNLSKGQQARINLARAVYKQSDIYLLDDCLSALDNHVNIFVYKKCIMEFLADKIVIMVTHNINHFKLVYGNNTLTVENGKTPSLEQQKEIMEKRITYYIDDVDNDHYEGEEIEIRDVYSGTDETSQLLAITYEQPPKLNLYHEEKRSGKVTCAIYMKYFKYAGGCLAIFLLFMAFFLSVAGFSYTEKIVSQWVNVEPKLSGLLLENKTDTEEYEQVLHERNFLLNLYCIVVAASSALVFMRTFLNFFFCLRASKRIHNAISASVLNSFMEFFDNHYIGNIVNRFSKDLYAVDETIPGNIYEIFRTTFTFLGVIFLIASVNALFMIPAVLLVVKLYFVRRYYMSTGRDIKRLESASRSPMIGYLNAALEGLTTVRASENQSLITNEFDKHQDLFLSAYYMVICTTRAFGFLLDMISSSFIAVIVVKFVFTDSSGFTSGDVGLALSQAIGLTGMLQWMVRQYSDIESNMTSVERAIEYVDIRTENKRAGQIREDWPNRGKIEFRDVSLSYSTAREQVLKNVSFIIQPMEKIGIVGRTGAGKSSIVSSLFRLYNYEGKILIDDVETKSLSLEFLRSNMAIIPQDPTLFSGSIRSNLDPLERFSDETLWKALDNVGLKKTFCSLEESITENGSNYSLGQKQLVCLARALASKCKIIVMDEATANMDPETCNMIKNIIKTSFTNCTVITIAHRLNTIIRSDKVMVVDDGQIVEFDSPVALVEKDDGIFKSMIQQSGLDIID